MCQDVLAICVAPKVSCYEHFYEIICQDFLKL